MSQKLLSVAVGLALLSLPAAAADAAVFAARNPATQDRFLNNDPATPNPTFLLSGFANLSGVAVDRSGPDSTPARGATLIAPNYYLTETHFPANGPEFLGSDGVVRGYATADTRVLTTTFVDDDGQTQTAASDILIGRLATSPTADGVATLPIATGSQSAFVNRRVFAFGQDNVAGTNIIEPDLVGLAFQADGPNGTSIRPTIVAGFDFDTPSNGGTNGTPDEIGLTPGDSSNPQLIAVDGELALIGGHFGINDPTNPDGPFDFTANYDSFSSLAGFDDYLDQIQAFIGETDATGQSIRVVAVPEPTALLAAAVALPLLIRRRRRT